MVPDDAGAPVPSLSNQRAVTVCAGEGQTRASAPDLAPVAIPKGQGLWTGVTIPDRIPKSLLPTKQAAPRLCSALLCWRFPLSGRPGLGPQPSPHQPS